MFEYVFLKKTCHSKNFKGMLQFVDSKVFSEETVAKIL